MPPKANARRLIRTSNRCVQESSKKIGSKNKVIGPNWPNKKQYVVILLDVSIPVSLVLRQFW
jgi:hypothetical protein